MKSALVQEPDLASVVAALGGTLFGDSASRISGLAPLESASGSEISFLSHPKYQQQLLGSMAACVIVSPGMESVARQRGACIVVDDPYLYFAKLTQWWKRLLPCESGPKVHPTAVIHETAFVDPSASVGPLCVVERGASIGANTVLKSRVTVSEGCSLGQRCVVHPGVVIGADGFGFALTNGTWEKIEQLGGVRIGNDVEIGANTCIDRGALSDTVIEDGVKLDNLIQIGHNVHIGKHTAMAGCVGVAGSATIGAHCTVGGGGIVLGHLSLADHVNVSAATVVTRSIRKPGTYTGMFPIDDNSAWEKNAASLKQLHSLRDRIRVLEETLKTMENK
ncbi:UDP-3-O-(3-hydroxymyristoyl)glucosamine N-acyltransferase [Rhodoferax aquaticus]|uniref:UDP-3-O-acylglucosamine N-acyltransferase n=1 Tax=Rhodoferax aquaticus TaxID=2527691 RepID=A0A515ENU9_9BURK|nr:UDP-3-O-(3-hydroxymyristoyl)glucosamine N-acyltransferase [Rhodoferax aquaticus]QDL54315.1 UDP-3-O-(3-hydroxymyristoyl)glucosamine N-acyltransferase [Rhodoferax aquaticus]